MSYHLVNFIPNDPTFKLTAQQINAVKQLDDLGDVIGTEVNDAIQLVMEYEGFGEVLCPFCHSDLFDWWGDSMSAAYSEDSGYELADLTTPCCGKSVSLQNLDYSPKIGLYKSIIIMSPKTESIESQNLTYENMKIPSTAEIDDELICELLKTITGVSWRAVHTYNN